MNQPNRPGRSSSYYSINILYTTVGKCLSALNKTEEPLCPKCVFVISAMPLQLTRPWSSPIDCPQYAGVGRIFILQFRMLFYVIMTGLSALTNSTFILSGLAEANFYWSGQPRIFVILVRPNYWSGHVGPAVAAPPALIMHY